MLNSLIWVLGIILDRLLGDPRWMPHPVVGIGKIIGWGESLLNRKDFAPLARRLLGSILVVVVVVGAWLATETVLKLCSGFTIASVLVATWLFSTTMAMRSLGAAGQEIAELLEEANLEQARVKLSWIVGRDTDGLPENEIARGAAETVAENIVDGIISPLFYALLGGVPLAMAYRAVNTLDSMLGYKNERFLDFGWAAARLDDLANLIPARMTVPLILLAGGITGRDWPAGWRMVIRDAAKHPSPNSGYPEAAVAGTLGVRFGGINVYGGQSSFRAYLGDDKIPHSSVTIRGTVALMSVTAWLASGIGLLIL